MIVSGTLAKSNGTTLAQHTQHVVSAMEIIAARMCPSLRPRDLLLLRHGAILHDLGKAHPFFQLSLKPGFDRRNHHMELPHRHEISSILFLPCFSKAEWPKLIEMVVAHHKSLRSHSAGVPGKGLIDLVEVHSVDYVFERHAGQWEQWQQNGLAIVAEFGISTSAVSLEAAREAFDFTVAYCDGVPCGRNQWRGLLMTADHLASALQEDTDIVADRLFIEPDLAVFNERAETAAHEMYPLSKKPVDSPKRHTLVIAPTGSGKTDLLLRRCRSGRVFYVLPFQASINAMYRRLQMALNGDATDTERKWPLMDIRRQHSAAMLDSDDGFEQETVLYGQPGAAIKVMTPHQIAAVVFGLAGHESIALDLAGQNVILDEVHVYSQQTQAMVLEIVKSLVRLNCRVHIGSATIPTSLARLILDAVGGVEGVETITLTLPELMSYDRHIVVKLQSDSKIDDFIAKSVTDKNRMLVVANRVAHAQRQYSEIQADNPGVPIMLLHSRYRRCDRMKIERKIDDFNEREGPCIVCSTQVLEVSLDISFDTMLTECAPLDSLIQRFGRVNRRRLGPNERQLRTVAVIAPSETVAGAKPYMLETLQRTWECLQDGAVVSEAKLQAMIDAVYPSVDLAEIEVHLIEPNGEMRLSELCHLPKSTLLQTLEIEVASVIREADVEEYGHGKAADRQLLEIPVSYASVRQKLAEWRQLPLGNRPFVCPDHCYDETLGLLLDKELEPKCIIL